jgi:hypothetical protein
MANCRIKATLLFATGILRAQSSRGCPDQAVSRGEGNVRRRSNSVRPNGPKRCQSPGSRASAHAGLRPAPGRIRAASGGNRQTRAEENRERFAIDRFRDLALVHRTVSYLWYRYRIPSGRWVLRSVWGSLSSCAPVVYRRSRRVHNPPQAASLPHPGRTGRNSPHSIRNFLYDVLVACVRDPAHYARQPMPSPDPMWGRHSWRQPPFRGGF